MEAEEAQARNDTKAKVAELMKVVQAGAGLPDRRRHAGEGPDRTIHTHIEKFDTILGGGIPEGHVILVNGAPGTMKSTLTYTVLHNAALYDGVSSMYFSLEQSRASILRQMARLKMPDPHAAEHMMVVDMVDLRKEMEDVHRRLEGDPASVREERFRRASVPHLRPRLSRFVQGHVPTTSSPART